MNPYILLPQVPVVHGRQAVVLERCVGKRVLHLGCVDSGLMAERYQRGELMHQKLAEVASELWGIDLDADGVESLRDLGFPHVLVGDISQLDGIEEIRGQQFDVIVASEVVEHLLNPGQFLSSARRLMVPGETELIVTVPNAFRLDTLRWLMQGVEFVHPDHVYWFSYHTVTNLLRKCGFTIEKVYVYVFKEPHLESRDVARGVPVGRWRSRADHARAAIVGALQALPRVARDPIRHARALVARAVTLWLYRRTAFWGDGLVVVATAGETEDR